MKTKSVMLLIGIISMFFWGCQKTELPQDIQIEQAQNGELKTLIELCGDPIIGTLTSWDETVTAGNLIIGNDADSVYVTFETTNGWNFASTYLYVGSVESLPYPNAINGDGTGDFYVGSFPFIEWHNGILSKTFSIGRNTLDDCFLVVAYANVEKQTPAGILESIVWGKSNYKSSGFYMDYCVQQCSVPPPPPPIGTETCYAYGEQYAYCFSEFNKKTGAYNPGGAPNKNFNNWGWTNGLLDTGTYDFELWAGAGQCDLSKGTLVGNLVIDYNGSTAMVTYIMIPGYVLSETHLYIGSNPIPTGNNNKPTLAPGQFPYKHGSLNNVNNDTYTVGGLSGDIYVIAHGVANDAP